MGLLTVVEIDTYFTQAPADFSADCQLVGNVKTRFDADPSVL
jgi:hypothetical protein